MYTIRSRTPKWESRRNPDPTEGITMEKRSTLLAILLVFGAIGARAGLITNGSFETPVVPVGFFTNYPSGSALLTGWTVVGTGGTEVSIVSGSFAQGGISFPAEDGTQWLDLTGDGTDSFTEGVEQTVSTTIGDLYTLSFYVGNVDNPAAGFGTTSTVDLYINGGFVGAFTNFIPNSTTQTWEQFTTSGVATAASTTIEFLNGDPGADNTNGLDNIVLTDDGPAGVPEPSTYGFMLIGLGLLVLMQKRIVPAFR